MTTADRERLELALAAAGLGEWSWDAQTDLVTFSRRAAEIYGIEPGPVLTWTQMRDLLHPDDREIARQAVETAIARREDYILEYRVLRGARERWIAASGRPLYDSTGRPIGMLGVVHDRTRERLLGSLDERLRPLGDTRAITQTAVTALGRALDVDRCAYCTVEADEDSFVLLGDYTQGAKSIVGRYRFASFGRDCVRLLRAGQPFVVADRRQDPRIAQENHAVYDQTTIEAVVCVPIHKSGRLVAAMAVHSLAPRIWSSEEVGLVGAVANRCWESIERARTEQTLRDNHERYQALLKSAGTIFWTAGPDGRVEADSESWRAYTGQTEAQWRGEGWMDAVHAEDRRRLKKEWPLALQRGEAFDTEYRLRHRDGTWRWTSVRVVPLLDTDGTIREWFGIHTDITARRLAERRDTFLVRLDDATRPLTEPAEIAQTILRLICEELAADRATYFEIDEDGFAGAVLADYAPRLVPLQGVYPLEEYGTEFALAVRSGSTYLLEDIEQAGLSAAERQRFDAIQIRAELMVPLHKAGKLKATLGLFQGTRRQWHVDEIQLCHLVVQRAWEALERARIERGVRQADQRKEEFIATLAHELRNPLAPIRNGLAILRRSDERSLRNTVQGMMERHVEHLVHMVDDLFDMSRINRGLIELQVRQLRLQDAVTQAVEVIRPALEATPRSLELDLPPEPVWVSGDPVRLTQIFSNLLHNALKFTSEDGRIRLCLTTADETALAVVEDDGLGIDPTRLNEIFESFAQAHDQRTRSRGGLGIGLSLVRRLIALHGGQVVAFSEGAGRGSRFEVRLPLTSGPDAAAIEPRTAPARGRLLVVDDNEDAADTIAHLLRDRGWQVAVAYDGQTALNVLRRFSPAVALLDLGMPGMDGFELARRIREADPSPPLLVALTGWGQAQDRARSKAAGFDHHLVKPVDGDTLTGLLHDWMAVSS